MPVIRRGSPHPPHLSGRRPINCDARTEDWLEPHCLSSVPTELAALACPPSIARPFLRRIMRKLASQSARVNQPKRRRWEGSEALSPEPNWRRRHMGRERRDASMSTQISASKQQAAHENSQDAAASKKRHMQTPVDVRDERLLRAAGHDNM